MKTKTIILLSIVFFIISCRHELKEGTIINMYVEPERSYMYMMPIPHVISNGKTTSTYFTYIPVLMHDDADYIIKLHGTTKKGEEKDETFYVSERFYNRYELGDKICVTEDCSKEPNGDSKIKNL